MNGFSDATEWNRAVGRQFVSVTLAQKLISLNFEPGLRIDVLSKILIAKQNGAEAIASVDFENVASILALLGQDVLEVLHESASEMKYVMTSGDTILFLDTDEPFESFVFELDGQTHYI